MKIVISWIQCQYKASEQRVEKADWDYERETRGYEQGGGVADGFINPNWSFIESSLELLRTKSGRIELYFGEDDGNWIQVDMAGGYYMVTNNIDVAVPDTDFNVAPALYFLIDKTIPVNEDPGETVGMLDGECRPHNTVTNFDVVVSMVKKCLESGGPVSDGPYVWFSRDDDPDRFRC